MHTPSQNLPEISSSNLTHAQLALHVIHQEIIKGTMVLLCHLISGQGMSLLNRLLQTYIELCI